MPAGSVIVKRREVFGLIAVTSFGVYCQWRLEKKLDRVLARVGG